jgi:hypothetical protein
MYSLTGIAEIQGTCVKKIVSEKGSGYEVMLCKKIPEIISPPVLFINSGYGIQSIKAPGLDIELVSYKKVKEDKRLLDCKKFFETRNISANGYDFFENYWIIIL